MSNRLNRYEVGTDHNGVDSHHESLIEARRRARDLADQDGCEVYVYDRMAHFGRAQRWRLTSNSTTVVEYRQREAQR